MILKKIPLGSGIREPGSGKNSSRIQGVKKHRIPDPGSATLAQTTTVSINSL
jgi:hypothetical protein